MLYVLYGLICLRHASTSRSALGSASRGSGSRTGVSAPCFASASDSLFVGRILLCTDGGEESFLCPPPSRGPERRESGDLPAAGTASFLSRRRLSDEDRSISRPDAALLTMHVTVLEILQALRQIVLMNEYRDREKNFKNCIIASKYFI